MGRSPGLALYLFAKSLGGLSGRLRADRGAWPPRPEGPLVWIRASADIPATAIRELAARLMTERQGLTVVVSAPIRGLGESLPDGAIATGAISDDPTVVLGHWRPDVVVFAGRFDAPATLVEAADAGVPCYLVDAVLPDTLSRRLRLAPRAGRSLFRRAGAILARSEEDRAAFLAQGVPEDSIAVMGALQDGAGALPCNEADRADLAATLAARPVWAAVSVPGEETALVLEAHQEALRASHRLLLILVPSEGCDPGAAAHAAREAGLSVAQRGAAEEPDAGVQVYVTEAGAELGLWYRIAPIAYLGGTISGATRPRDPFEAAALGSAVLAGPNGKAHRETLARLRQDGAARTVRSADALARAVADLLSPDRAAEMARRAWDIASAGAEATDRAVELILGALDAREAA